MGKAFSIRSLTCNPLALLGLVLWLMASGFCCPKDFHQGSCHCSHDHDEIFVSCRGITHVPRDLPPNTTKLYLTYCGITHIDGGSFKAMKKLSELYLTHCGITHIDGGSFKAMKSLSELSLSNNNISLSAFKVFSRQLKSVKSLGLSGNPMGPYLTSDTFSGFNDTEYLYLAHCGIAHIDGGTFKAMKKLSELSLNDNSISLNAFKVFSRDLKSVGKLDLSGNPMGPYLTSDTFSGFNDTEYLSLAGCGITHIDGGTLKAMKKLSELYLSRNKLKVFVQDTFHFPDLLILDLSFNNLRFIPDELFSGCEQLDTLFLQNNHLEHIPQSAFQNLKKLEIMNLAFNNLRFIPDEVFSGCEQLHMLYLQNNHLEHIPQSAFQNLKKLEIMDLSSNNLLFIRDEVFSGCEQLNTLFLQNNHLEHIPQSAFQNLKKLEMMDLSSNNLRFLPDEIFSDCEQLDTLFLSFNRLSDISRQTFAGLKSLKLLWVFCSFYLEITTE